MLYTEPNMRNHKVRAEYDGVVVVGGPKIKSSIIKRSQWAIPATLMSSQHSLASWKSIINAASYRFISMRRRLPPPPSSVDYGDYGARVFVTARMTTCRLIRVQSPLSINHSIKWNYENSN